MSDYYTYRKRQIRIFELENLFLIVDELLRCRDKKKMDEILTELKAKMETIKELPGPDRTHEL